jgi:aerobic-type carbon monoxide dehydrogenase small subunit (CoxS/CutS family)
MTSAPKIEIAFALNGVQTAVAVEATTLAFDLLRDELAQTSIRTACDGLGMCGACTILVDGLASPSCLMLALDLADRSVETAEGLAKGDALHPLQEAFVAMGALQCGYCTGGMLLAAKALLDENPHPSRDEIIRGLTGNLCRCTGYAKIVEAIEFVATGKAA